jgi:hypothetical protein
MITIKYIIHVLIASSLSSLSLSAAPNLVGEWITTYGRYSETVTYKADGTYVSVTEIVRGPAANEDSATKSSGTWKMNGEELVHTSNGKSHKMKIRVLSPNSFENLSASDAFEGRIWEKSIPVQKVKASNPGKVTEPKIGSPERKAIMDAMRGPVSKHAKTEVIFTGSVAVYEDWAKLDGHVNPKNGKAFAEEVVDELELDFLAILQKVDGKWKTLYYGWSGDIGTRIEAREKFPNIPEVLLPKIPQE